MDTAQNNQSIISILEEISEFISTEEELLEGETLDEILALIEDCKSSPTEEKLADLMTRLAALGAMNEQLANMYETAEKNFNKVAEESLDELGKLGAEVDSQVKELEREQNAPAISPVVNQQTATEQTQQNPASVAAQTVDTTVTPISAQVEQTTPAVQAEI